MVYHLNADDLKTKFIKFIITHYILFEKKINRFIFDYYLRSVDTEAVYKSNGSVRPNWNFSRYII